MRALAAVIGVFAVAYTALGIGLVHPLIAAPILGLLAVAILVPFRVTEARSAPYQWSSVWIVLGALSLGLALHLFAPPSSDTLAERVRSLDSYHPRAEFDVTVSAVPWIGPLVVSRGTVPGVSRSEQIRLLATSVAEHYDVTMTNLRGDSRAGLRPEDWNRSSLWDLIATDGRSALRAVLDDNTVEIVASWSAPGVGAWPYDESHNRRDKLLIEAVFEVISGLTTIVSAATLAYAVGRCALALRNSLVVRR